MNNDECSQIEEQIPNMFEIRRKTWTIAPEKMENRDFAAACSLPLSKCVSASVLLFKLQLEDA